MVHERDAVRHLRDHGEVVSHQNQAHAAAARQGL